MPRNSEQYAVISALANATGELASRRDAFLSQYEIVKTMIEEAESKGVETALITGIVGDTGKVNGTL